MGAVWETISGRVNNQVPRAHLFSADLMCKVDVRVMCEVDVQVMCEADVQVMCS